MNNVNFLSALRMKLRTLGIIGLLVLSPALCHADTMFFNPDDNTFFVFDNHFKVFGPGTGDSPLCRQSGSECETYIQNAEAINSFNMATRNAWIAILLNAVSTNKHASIEYDSSTGFITRISPSNF